MTNDEVFQRAKEESLLLKIFKNRRHLWIGHTIRHNEFVVNILGGAIPGKKGRGKTQTTVLEASRQKHRSNEKNGLQQFQMESCQPIKRLKDKKKKNENSVRAKNYIAGTNAIFLGSPRIACTLNMQINIFSNYAFILSTFYKNIPKFQAIYIELSDIGRLNTKERILRISDS